ncbi:Hypothetical predicted protein [Mytilus galloprovincialis]|uniref:Peptidase A2 domain-containing protein n=1 Tax=Mytilus galloprovincialis TaxID=29158 RepID=A0A8B6E390_MYTGA|nr:Hypothetical predicted protein [Mytilus galloprovincialis]
MGQRSTTAEWPSTVRINNSKTSEEGFYLDMTICCKHISMLVDTGASVTILSQKFLKTINPSSMPEITPVKMNMMTATGEISPFIGEFEAYLRLGKNLIKHKVLVADMPTEGILEKHGLLIAKAVVQPNSGFIPIKIFNLSNVEHVIQKNTVAAMLEPVEADMIEPCQNINAVGSTETNAENIPMPDHIQTVYDSNINELSENQKVQFKELLLKFQNSFSKSATDIGRTELIEHSIDIRQAHPIKQRPRRVPLAKILEAEIAKMAEQVGKNVVVAYIDTWYPGQVIGQENTIFKVKFLHPANGPEKEDISEIDEMFIFYLDFEILPKDSGDRTWPWLQEYCTVELKITPTWPNGKCHVVYKSSNLVGEDVAVACISAEPTPVISAIAGPSGDAPEIHNSPDITTTIEDPLPGIEFPMSCTPEPNNGFDQHAVLVRGSPAHVHKHIIHVGTRHEPRRQTVNEIL